MSLFDGVFDPDDDLDPTTPTVHDYFVDESGGPDATAARVDALRMRLRAERLAANVVHSHGKYVDVLPARANKGLAVAFAAAKLGVPNARVFVSGDSGNDIDMLANAANPVIVANHRDGIVARADLRHAYVASEPFAGGIIEGVEHFEAAPSAPAERGATPPATA